MQMRIYYQSKRKRNFFVCDTVIDSSLMRKILKTFFIFWSQEIKERLWLELFLSHYLFNPQTFRFQRIRTIFCAYSWGIPTIPFIIIITQPRGSRVPVASSGSKTSHRPDIRVKEYSLAAQGKGWAMAGMMVFPHHI